MEALPASTSAAVAAPPAPAPAPAPSPAPAPAAAAPMPAAAPAPRGGMDSVKDAMRTMNWTEVIFGILGSAALFYTIYYYKYNLTMNKTFKNEMQNKIDDLTIKIADIQSASSRDVVETQQSFDGFF